MNKANNNNFIKTQKIQLTKNLKTIIMNKLYNH